MPAAMTVDKLGKKLNDAIEHLKVDKVRELIQEKKARAAIDEWALLGSPLEVYSEKPVPDKRLEIYRLLESTGASPNGSGDPRSVCFPLVSVMRGEINEDLRKQLFLELLNKGADPDGAMSDGAAFAFANLKEDQWFAEEMLRRGSIKRETFNDALRLAIERNNRPAMERALPHCQDVSGPSTRGLPPLYAGALKADDSVFERLLAAASTPYTPITRQLYVPIDAASPPTAGLIPQVTLSPGDTIIDLLERAAALVSTKAAEFERQDDEHRRNQRREFLERVSNRIAKLAGGAPKQP